MKKQLVSALLGAAFVAATSLPAFADAAAGKAIADDKAVGNCGTCHYMDKADKKVGPGLKGVTSRVSKDWLKKWLADPQAIWDENGPEVQDLKTRMNKASAKKTAMKTPKKLTDQQIQDVIDYLDTLK